VFVYQIRHTSRRPNKRFGSSALSVGFKAA